MEQLNFFLEFGAKAYYGMKFEVGVKVLAMTGFATVIPYGGVKAYGSVGICFAVLCGKLQLDAHVMETRFPSTAEIAFNKFPLDVGYVIYIDVLFR